MQMNTHPKGKSPFYPGQPVPVELFVGRTEQIEYIKQRGVGQVNAGKPVAMFIQGEYGIGKSSIAGFVQAIAEWSYQLHSLYVPIGGAESLNDLAETILEATLRSGALNPTRSERVKEWLAKYVGEQNLLGQVTVHLENLKKDAPTLTSATGILSFLSTVVDRLKDTGVNGVFLVLDEINGISNNPKFAHFIKGLVDTNAMSRDPVPLLLMLCGVEERRREMIKHHQPIERVFSVIEIEAMNDSETTDFFKKAFDSVGIAVESDAMSLMVKYSAGFPKIIHLIGDAAFWLDRNGIINHDEAFKAIIIAADEVGKKYVDQQVYKALRSEDYRSILKKIASVHPESMTLEKSEVAEKLTAREAAKFNNFLQKMKKLKVLRSGDVQGEWIFNHRMVRLYILLKSLEPSKFKD
jgi:hypothetical protein